MSLDRLSAALADRYRIERELGAGGMATVYLAEDLKHHRKVALKVLRPELAATVGPERFVREIEIAAALHHPHILPLYDSGSTVPAEGGADPFLYYVMPYVEGESLRDRLAREGELPIVDTVRILREVADALAKAHSQGVVHRDIKPDNVLLADRHAVVADFGVAKAVSEATGRHGITTVGVALGTPTYMAPEQASADPNVDHRADIYAFGVLAYEMLTGAPPFTGTSQQAVLAAHVTQAAPAIQERRAAVPDALADLVTRCLEKKAADRWQHAEEIVRQLEVLVTPSGGIEPTTAQPAVRSPSWSRALIGGVAIALIAGAAAVFAMMGRGGDPVALDPNLIAVLPFRVSGTGDDLDRLREGMVDLMATYLTGEGGTARSADPGTVIGAWRGRVSDDAEDLSAEDAANLARSLGAGWVLMGSVVGSDARLVLRGTLASSDGRQESIQASVEGAADSLLALLPRFAGQLVAQSAGMAADQSAALVTNSLPALRAYLVGQAEYRRGRFERAVAAYSDAIEADTNFALAGVGLIAASGWAGGATAEVMGHAVRAAWGNRDALTVKDRALVVASLGPGGTAPDSRLDILRAREAAVQTAPDRAEAWYLLGDAYFHDGALLGVDDALGRADEAFRRAIGRDSLQAGVLQHLLLLAADRGDTAMVRQWESLYRRAVRDRTSSVPEEWFAAVVLGDDSARDAALTFIDTGAVVLEFGVAYRVPFLHGRVAESLEYLERSQRRTVGSDDRDRLALMRAFVNLDLGRPRAAAEAFDDVGSPIDGVRVLAALFWGGDTSIAARAVARLTTRPDTGGVFEIQGTDLCARSAWRLLTGDGTGIGSAVSRLRATAEDRDPTFPPTLNQLCADVLEALDAQRAGRRDAGVLIDRVDRALATAPNRVVGWLNLVAARLLEGEGEYARAAAAARRHIHYFGYTPFYSTHLRESGRLAELAGDRDAAIEAYSKYLDLRQEPEESVRAEVEQVRDALGRLVGERR